MTAEPNEKAIEIDRDEVNELDDPAADRSLAHTNNDHGEPRPSVVTGIFLPVVYLVVILLGGIRLSSADNSFLFLKPALICLVFAALTLILAARAGLVSIDGWLTDRNSVLANIANSTILFTLFGATVQIYNSLLPEQGLPFWIVGFCFLWTLWNSLFTGMDAKRLLRSFGALFGLAFIVKYLLLANLTAPEGANWLQRLINDPGREAFTWLLDLPRYSSGTGYIQFFTICFYLIGLYLTPASNRE